MKLLNCFSLFLLLATSPVQAWIQFLDGSTLPTAPWIAYQDGPVDGRGETVVVNFVDPVGGTNNQALRVNSGPGSTQWYIGPLLVPEVVAAARFRLVSFSPTGRENLLCVQVGGGGTHAPSVSISLVDGRYKIWAYTFGEFGATNSGLEIQDIGSVTSNQFHTAYIYCHQDGATKVWWDGQLIYDDKPISLGGYDGYIEWGSGSWQFNASDVVDFDWVGYGGPSDLPQYLTSSPVHNTIHQSGFSQFQFNVHTTQGAGVGTNGLRLRVNGLDRTAELIIGGTDTNRQGTLTGLLPNYPYQMQVQVTNLAGSRSLYRVEFDTFSRTNFTVEAEDFNFGGGQFIDNVVLASNPSTNNYLDQDGIEDIDHNELSTDPTTSSHDYRLNSLVGTERTGDVLRQKYVEAQATDPLIRDYNLTAVQVGEWLNYTRTFPTGTFHIYARLASGQVDAPFEATLSTVVGASNANQTVSLLGSFKGIGHHAQTYSYVPLTDAQSNLVSVTLEGVGSLRLTSTVGAFNANYFMLAPAGGVIPSPRLIISKLGPEVRISWTGTGFILERTDRLGGTWTAVTNQSNPYSFLPTGSNGFFRLRR